VTTDCPAVKFPHDIADSACTHEYVREDRESKNVFKVWYWPREVFPSSRNVTRTCYIQKTTTLRCDGKRLCSESMTVRDTTLYVCERSLWLQKDVEIVGTMALRNLQELSAGHAHFEVGLVNYHNAALICGGQSSAQFVVQLLLVLHFFL